MAGSSASPFASASGSSSPFGSSPKPTASPFAGVGTSTQGGLGGFGGSGFGGFGQKAPTSGFGALAAKSGPDVISSAPKRLLQPLGSSKPAKPFGAPEDYSDEGGSDEEGGEDDESGDDDKSKKEKEPKHTKSEVFQETEGISIVLSCNGSVF